MQRLTLFLLIALLVSACNQNVQTEDELDAELRAHADVAVSNLKRIRDAAVKYRKATGEIPESIDQLAEHGAAEDELDDSEVYSVLGYNYTGLLFDDDGNLARGWFFATPRADADGMKVRFNGVTEQVEMIPKDAPWLPAEDDDWIENNETEDTEEDE
jgi:hypothetical protein